MNRDSGYSGVRAALLVPQDEPPNDDYEYYDDNSTTTANQQPRARVLQVIDEAHDEPQEDGGAVTVVANENEDLFLKGEPQPLEYRDQPWAVAFAVQLLVVVGTAIALGGFSGGDGDDGTTDGDDDGTDSTSSSNSGNSAAPLFLWWLTGTSLGGVAATGLALRILTRHARRAIQISFFAAPILLAVVALLVFLLDPQSRDDGLPAFYAGMAVVLGAVATCYYFYFKRYMPFAAANLQTALACLKSNVGLVLVAWGNGPASFLYVLCWFFAVLGLYNYAATHHPQHPCSSAEDDQHPDNDGMCDATPNVGLVLVFLLCLFWSHQVFQNVLHVVTAGTVGTWWFAAENGGDDNDNDGYDYNRSSRSGGLCWCGWGNVGDSLYRALTYSFGSICLGSLLVAILQTLESVLRSARRNRRRSALLLCVLECLVHLLRRWMEYFNAWAMVYVGLYGYDYLTAGKNVVRLFQSTGWTAFIADRLVYRVVLFCHLGIGVATGCWSLLVDMMAARAGAGSSSSSIFSDPDAEDPASDRVASHATAFFGGFLLGLFLSSTVLFVAESAVRTVIVCFAESPAEFHANHPELCDELTRGWSETYPAAWAARHRRVQAATNPPQQQSSSSTAVPMADARVAHDDDHHDVEAESTGLI